MPSKWSERAPEKLCGANRKGGRGTCTQLAGMRTDHNGYGRCWLHGGAHKNGRKQAARLKEEHDMAELAVTLVKMGLTIEVDPPTALLEAVWEAAGNVRFLRERCAELGVDVVGPVMALSREGIAVPIAEDARAVVKLYGEWNDRLVKYSKVAIDAGIAERQVRLAEAQGYAIRDLIEAVLDGLQLDDAQRRTGREIAARRLTLLAGGAAA